MIPLLVLKFLFYFVFYSHHAIFSGYCIFLLLFLEYYLEPHLNCDLMDQTPFLSDPAPSNNSSERYLFSLSILYPTQIWDR